MRTLSPPTAAASTICGANAGSRQASPVPAGREIAAAEHHGGEWL
jgi:hypothetical protein